MKRKKTVIISGGGTAGHLYPALCVGQKLREKDSSLAVTYVGSHRSREKKIMQHHKVDYIPLKIEGLKGRGIKTLKAFLLLPLAFMKSLFIILRKKPLLVIGVGGYSSGPVVLLSAWMKIPTLVMEQNQRPGFTNRALLPWVKAVVVAFESSLSYFRNKGVFIGNPVREGFYHLPQKTRNHKLSLLIFGGSQGSHFLNQKIIQSLPLIQDLQSQLIMFHQTGEKDLEWVRKNYALSGFKNTTIEPFFYDMENFFQKSDLIVSRSGATTIAELIAARKASLLIPFAKATDNHQALNAKELEKIGGAEVLLEKDFVPEKFAAKIQAFIKDKAKIDRMEENLKTVHVENVAEKISDLCFKLIKTHAQET